MTKRISAVVGEYTNKEGQQKAEWANIGIIGIGIGKNGKEYILLDPSVSMAGILVKQNVLAQKRNEQPSDMVMVSPFEDVPQGQQQGGYDQQAPQQQGHNQPQNNNGFQQR
jgi:hypothetical protein